MAKKQKRNRREEERRMIAEMEAAMWERKSPAEQQAEQQKRAEERKGRVKSNETEQKLHCPRCKSVMENGKCSTCGHYIYVPMDEAKRKKIRLAVGIVCTVGFVILFVLLQFKK